MSGLSSPRFTPGRFAALDRTIVSRPSTKLLGDLNVLEFDQVAATEYGRLHAELQQAGITVPGFDLLIAATAIVRHLTLVTHDLSDFQRVPGLRVVDWR